MATGGVLVLGVGNVLMGDDGLGPMVAAALRREPGLLPAGTLVLDGGTQGLMLLPLLDGHRALLVVDAVDMGPWAGAVTVLRGSACEGALGQRFSVHQVALADLLAAARLTGFAGEVSVVGVRPQRVDAGLGLSAAVMAALPEALAAARAEAWNLADAA